MDDLKDEPEKVAEDIINQATKAFKFRQSAIDRIVQILESYHQLQLEIADLKQQQKAESELPIDGSFIWQIVQGKKQGPYCAACYTKDKELIQLIDVKYHSGHCAKCGRFCTDSQYDDLYGPDDEDNGGYSWYTNF